MPPLHLEADFILLAADNFPLMDLFCFSNISYPLSQSKDVLTTNSSEMTMLALEVAARALEV